MTMLEPGQSYHVYMPFFNSPVDFWLQLAGNTQLLDDLNCKIDTMKDCRLQQMQVHEIKPGTACIAYASEYAAYYRAVVSNIRKSEKKCLVTYVDYGNVEEKEFHELYTMHHSYTQLSSQGIPCCLLGGRLDSEDIDRYMSSDNLQALVVKVCNSGKHIVQLHEGHLQATASLQSAVPVKKPKVTDASHHFTPMQFNVGSTFPVCIFHVEDTGTFYCQLMENRWKIDELMVDLQTFYAENGLQATSLNKGDAVIVKNGKEDVCHRAVVLSASVHEVHVKYVDLGDTESVPHLKVLMIDERHVEMPSQAICCQLDETETLPPSTVAAFLRT